MADLWSRRMSQRLNIRDRCQINPERTHSARGPRTVALPVQLRHRTAHGLAARAGTPQVTCPPEWSHAGSGYWRSALAANERPAGVAAMPLADVLRAAVSQASAGARRNTTSAWRLMPHPERARRASAMTGRMALVSRQAAKRVHYPCPSSACPLRSGWALGVRPGPLGPQVVLGVDIGRIRLHLSRWDRSAIAPDTKTGSPVGTRQRTLACAVAGVRDAVPVGEGRCRFPGSRERCWGSVEGLRLPGQLFQDRCVVAVHHGGVVAVLELLHPPV